MGAYAGALTAMVTDYLDGKTVKAMLVAGDFEDDPDWTSVDDVAAFEAADVERVTVADVAVTYDVDLNTVLVTCTSPIEFALTSDVYGARGPVFYVDETSVVLCSDLTAVGSDVLAGAVYRYSVASAGLLGYAIPAAEVDEAP